MSTIIATDEEHEAVCEKVKTILSDDAIASLGKQLRNMADQVAHSLWSDIESNLQDDITLNLCGTAQRMAERFVEAVLRGDENAARHAFTLGAYFTGREGLDRPSFGPFFEPEVIAMRRRLVEAHRDLLSNARIEDLEAQLKGRDAEIERLRSRISDLEHGVGA